MPFSASFIIEILGTISFTVSGVYSALQKRLDILGVLVIAFVTATGGGTIRDVLIGVTPVTWMRDLTLPCVILITTPATIIFRKKVRDYKITLFLFDAIGLGLFTIIGLQKGLSVSLHPAVCVVLGTVTGCFGSVVRDVLLNQIPTLFRTEIYATPSIAGGILYFVLLPVVDKTVVEVICIIFISGIRIIAFTRKWRFPSFL
ncbi:trimeric intracellular cation channel family protein [Filimonas effusa]|uniref:Trimeric intracellular cation channel family protein n=2 Tax=Filimonas effusa TaxID=2508721 RepID=A0A4Q1D0D3_9BACT|nr:trimeric intracellular cation channel family protein [Filimonas effusa]